MSKVSVTKDKLDILANVIANKSGEPLTLTLDEMVSAVEGIQVGGGGGSVTQDQDGFIILPPDGSGGGGGGSGDFSTAEVTFLFTGLPEGVTPFRYLPFISINIGTYDNPNIWSIPETNDRNYDDGIFTTILYKGTAFLFEDVASVMGSDNNSYVRDYENPVTLSGAIEEDGDFIITGDCSITVPLVAE